jgi:predicted RNA-binding Zn-ribbon protein involved in translation (DUF1610 family)
MVGDISGVLLPQKGREIDMSTYGSVIRCPACGTEHVIRVGEIANQRRIEFTCTNCSADVVLDNEIQEPAVHKKGRWDN